MDSTKRQQQQQQKRGNFFLPSERLLEEGDDPGIACTGSRGAQHHMLQSLWTMFGAVPVLCCYVASMPQQQQPENGGDERQSAYFIAAAAGAGLLWIVCQLFLGRNMQAAFAMATAPPLLASAHFICSAAVFLIFCQQHPQAMLSRTKANGTTFSESESFSEHAYTLALLAACRLLAASFRSDAGAVPSCCSSSSICSSRTLGGGAQPFLATCLPALDAVLSLCSPLAFAVMCLTLTPSSSYSHTLVGDSAVAYTSRWQQWVLFAILAATYLGDRTVAAPGQVVHRCMETTARTLVLCVGALAFHLNMTAASPPGNSEVGRMEFRSLRAWGTANSLVRMLPQIWMALLTARLVLSFIRICKGTRLMHDGRRWFVALSSIVMQHLQSLRIDLQGRHAADLDDIHFSLAAACLFAASCASTPSSSPFARLLLLPVIASAFGLQFGILLLHWLAERWCSSIWLPGRIGKYVALAASSAGNRMRAGERRRAPRNR